MRAAWQEIARIIELKSEPLPASPPRLSDHDVEELDRLAPQAQAELLLERAINNYQGAIEWIARYVEAWRGNISGTGKLGALLPTALNSNDLRVRAAAIEVYLAVYNLPKTPESVTLLIQKVQYDPGSRPWALWALGFLGNRGVEMDRVRETLLAYIHDPAEQARFWAVEGLAQLGTDETIPVLLEIFHNDTSLQVRERAACSLAQSGMLRKEQRMKAVPELLNYTDDPALDGATRGWVYQALRDITGQRLPNEPAAWRNWWASQPQ